MLSKEFYDCIVAGSGIAGNVFAYLFAGKNRSCLILEKQRFRIEKVCGGGVSYKALSLLQSIGINLEKLQTLEHRDIIGLCCMMRNETLEKRYKDGRVSMGIQRQLFDEFLLQQAIEKGAIIHYGTPVNDVKLENDLFIINGKYYTNNFIPAIGAKSFKNPVKFGQSFGLSALISGESLLSDDKFYYWYYDTSDDRYCWLFPIGNELWNVGIWNRSQQVDIREKLSNWLKKLEDIYFPSGINYVTKIRGAYLGNLDQRDDRIFANGIGDFAGKNNMKNGGGIIGAIQSAIDVANAMLQ